MFVVRARRSARGFMDIWTCGRKSRELADRPASRIFAEISQFEGRRHRFERSRSSLSVMQER
jgi:hypothetical protein